jgi:hypothetical protein
VSARFLLGLADTGIPPLNSVGYFPGSMNSPAVEESDTGNQFA